MAGGDSFEEFYATAYRRIVGQVFALLGDLHEAEDLTQDAFAKASFHWSRIGAYDAPAAWVRRVAFNQARNRARRTRRGLVALARHGPPDLVPAISPDRVDVHRAMRQLTLRHREVLCLPPNPPPHRPEVAGRLQKLLIALYSNPGGSNTNARVLYVDRPSDGGRRPRWS